MSGLRVIEENNNVILHIENGNGGALIGPLTVTENGTYTAEQGLAYNPVNVDVKTIFDETGAITLDNNNFKFKCTDLTYDLTSVFGFTYNEDISRGLSMFDKVRNVHFKKCTNIGDYAFAGCEGLRTVGYANDIVSYPIKRIGINAFSGCRTLTDIGNILVNVEKIDKNAFNNCSMLSRDLTANNLIELGDNAFMRSGINGFTSTSLKKMGEGVFKNDYIESISLHNINIDSVEEIKKEVFYNCIGLRTVSLQSCKKIGARAFYNCKSTFYEIKLPSILSEEDNIQNEYGISGTAFEKCNHLMRILLPRHAVCLLEEPFDVTFADCLVYTRDASDSGWGRYDGYGVFVPADMIQTYLDNEKWNPNNALVGKIFDIGEILY